MMGVPIGMMSLPDDPWERGECGYKWIQYMVSGVPVTASPVGVNSEIVQPGIHSEPAIESAEWVQTPQMLSVLEVTTRARNA